MKNSLLAICFSCSILTTFLFCSNVYGVEGLSANVAVTNNYLWRVQY